MKKHAFVTRKESTATFFFCVGYRILQIPVGNKACPRVRNLKNHVATWARNEIGGGGLNVKYLSQKRYKKMLQLERKKEMKQHFSP